MNLRDLVEVNQQGMLHSSINFKLMDDPDTNLELCKSYVFNYDRQSPTESTLGVLDRVRKSFHSRNEPNVHCMVMQYGKGKSHFGLALANFFSKPYNSPEVSSILDQIAQATLDAPAIGESLTAFKKNQPKPQLVLCLSGDWGGNDIRKHLFDQLLRTLTQAGLDPSPLNLCAEPLRYLKKISTDPAKTDQANTFLEQKAETGETEYDLDSLISLLQHNTTEVISLVIELYQHLEDFAPNFNADINVTELLTAVLETYCKGDQAPFKGMLIIFDEMNYYLNFWKSNEIAAGGTALQNITNLCEEYKSQLALLSFTQIRFRTEAGTSADSRESYLKLSTRISPKDTTYDPRSSLELVIDNLLVQKVNTPQWQDFEEKWRETFTAEARALWEGSGKRYLAQGWIPQQIRQHLSAGVFPLHPYTTYLLANLSFTQDRTAIQFLRGTVTDFIATQPAEALGGTKPTYLYATTLIENFLENYDPTLQTQYRAAVQALSDSENQDEMQVLQAVFLYWASDRNLSKNSDQEPHEVILGHLTGLSSIRLASALDRLTKHYRTLYYNANSKLYIFYQGANPRELEEEIERRAENRPSSIAEVVGHAQGKLKDYLRTETLPGLRFVQEKRLIQEEWQFEQRFVSIDGLERILSNAHSLQKVSQKGLVLYVLAESQGELQELQRTIEAKLDQSPVGDRVVVAIPLQGTEDLDRLLLKRQILSQMDSPERRNYGEAFQQLLEQWDKDIQRNLKRVIKTYSYYCQNQAKITTQEQRQADNFVSHLLANRYPFAPPIQGSGSLRPGHSTGSQVVRFTAQKLFCNDLTDQNINVSKPRNAHETVIKEVYCQTWGLLKHKGKKYHVQVPTHATLRQAWDHITQEAEKAKAADRSLPLLDLWNTLKAPPYGYSDYNFVVLLAGWLCYYNRTVLLNGRTQLSGRHSIPVETHPLKFWAETDIFTHPKTLVEEWIGTHRAALLFREGVEIPDPLIYPASWDVAQKYLEAVEKCLKSKEIEANDKVRLHELKEQVTQACVAVQTWLSPIETALSLASSTDIAQLISLYPQLWQSPPVLDMSGKPYVSPSSEQRDRQKTAQTQIRDRLEQLLTQDLAALPTIAACDQRQTQIEQLQQCSESLPASFPAFQARLSQVLTELETRRTLLKGKKTISRLEMQIQNFLQRNPLPASNPLFSHEQSLQELANLTSQLTATAQPDPAVLETLQQCQKKINEHISTLQNRLDLLRAGLATVADRPSFDRCRTTYSQLELLYKGSSQEKQSQTLADQIQKLDSDFNRLDKLQTGLTVAQSIAECDRLQAQIAQVQTQLHYPEQFKAAIAKLQQEIAQKASHWSQQLEQATERLQQLTNIAEARTYQADLFATKLRYDGSAQEPAFIALTESFNQWHDFFQLLETTPANTLDQCQAKLQKLDTWHQQQTDLSPALQALYSGYYSDLQHNLDRFMEAHKAEALKWWQECQQNGEQLNSLQGSQRFKIARTVQKRVDEGRAKYQHLIPEQKGEVDELHQRCSQILSEEQIEHIKHLFRQVSRADRPQLLKDLYEIAKAETEVF